MCGIVGIWGPAPDARDRFGHALAAIAHRGPDGEGRFDDRHVLLGHRRLAIIDLTDGGHQPMHDASSGAVLTFNGEIYNYLEVRAELEQQGVAFRTRSDTEVLLQAWLTWREGMFDRLNGMWAFAVWEPARCLLTLARDRFGVKPLYWAEIEGGIAFASEAKALVALEPSLAEPDPAAIYELVVNSRSHDGDASYYRRIAAVPAATVLRVRQDGRRDWHRYWDYPEPDDKPIGFPEAEEEFAYLMRDSVRLRLRSDVPVGLTLSGGLDSSAVLAASTALGSPLTCFTSVYGAGTRGEEHWARMAADVAGAELVSVPADGADWAKTIQSIVWHMDGPGYTPAVFPLWAIMQYARGAGVPVLLEGQGADELLAGYPQYVARDVLARFQASLRGEGSVTAAVESLKGLWRVTPPPWAMRWLARTALSSVADRVGPRRRRLRLMAPSASAIRTPVPAPPPAVDGLWESLWRDHAQAILPALLHYGDAISMAHGVEARLPFMDFRLVEWVFRRRPPLIVEGRTKEPVRRYLDANGMGRIARRPDKQGYPTPTRSWFAGPAGRAVIHDMIDRPNARIWDYVERSEARSLAEDGLAADDIALFHFYKLLSCHIWLEQRGLGSGVPMSPMAVSGTDRPLAAA